MSDGYAPRREAQSHVAWSGVEDEPAACVHCLKKVWHINDPEGRGSDCPACSGVAEEI